MMRMSRARTASARRLALVLTIVALTAVLITGVFVARAHSSAASSTTPPFPIGTLDAADVSGFALPSTGAMAGYHQSYATTFTGETLPANWSTYSGAPGGDPGGMFSPSAVSVANDLLSLTASQNATANPSTAGGNWISGGLCLCGIPGQVYGAFFYRSRVTGAGPSTVGLLWPDSNAWPPEIDFNETPSGGVAQSTGSVHFGANNQILLNQISIDMTQWHTWGVVWTPTQIAFTVDGEVWAVDNDPATIPDIPMHISIQQQTFCGASPAHACPTSDQSTQVDWVAEYSPDSSTNTTTSTTSSTTTSTTTTLPVVEPTTWTSTSVGSSMNNTASTNVSFPNLTASSAGELYAGYGYSSTNATDMTSASTTLTRTASGKDIFAINPDTSGTLAPTGTQSSAGTSSSVAAMIEASGGSGDVITPIANLQQAGGIGGSDALEVTPAFAGDAYVIAVRVASSSDYVASVTGGDADWSFLNRYTDTTDGQDIELWLGVINATDPAPIMVTLRTPNISASIVAQEFHDATPTSSTTVVPSTTTSTSVSSAPSTTTSTSTSTTVSSVSSLRRVRFTLSSPIINGRQARVTWHDAAVPVSKIWATIYTTPGCTKVAYTQTVPNAVDGIADGQIHFSGKRGGSPRNDSFSPSTTYYARVNAAISPGRLLIASSCLRVGRG